MTQPMSPVNHRSSFSSTMSSPTPSATASPYGTNSRKSRGEGVKGTSSSQHSPAKSAKSSLNKSTTSKRSASGSSSRPPTQVFTRGTVGAVKTTRRRTMGTTTSSTTRTTPASIATQRHLNSHQVIATVPRKPSSTSSIPPSSPSSSSRGSNPASAKAILQFQQQQQHFRNQQLLLPQAPESPTSNANSSVATSSVASTNHSFGSHSFHNNRNNLLVASTGSFSAPTDSTSDQGSVHSAPSFTLYSTASSKFSDSRDPASSRGGRGSKNGGASRNAKDALLGLQESDKLHIKATRRALDDLSRAQGSERRIAALTHVCENFDHNDEVKHNVELSQGSVQVLAKCLLVATNDDEFRMICAALEMVLRGSPRAVQLEYTKVGGAPLLTNVLRVLERCQSNRMKHAEISTLNISKIVLHLSRCSDLRIQMCRQQGVLDSLIGVTTDQDCRLARINALANLANCQENKVVMYKHEGLVQSIARIAHVDTSDLIRQYAGSALMELASAPDNQVAMANDDAVLGTLVKMTVFEKSTTTREFVITALQNMAFAKENRFRLVSFKDGVLLEALKKALSFDMDAKARRRAAGALTNLVCEETAELMGSQRGLLESLAIASNKDNNPDVQRRASLALTKIANLITVNMECHEALLDALVVASLSKSANSVSGVLRVKARDPENREVMARHPGVIDTLTDICISPGSKVPDRDNAIRAITHLINEDKNRKVLCNKTVLDALVAVGNYQEPLLEEARDSAIRAMERLATEFVNRESMARHPGLLTVVAKAVEREAEMEDTGKESDHGYLAKPLLMSLLVAM